MGALKKYVQIFLSASYFLLYLILLNKKSSALKLYSILLTEIWKSAYKSLNKNYGSLYVKNTVVEGG